jgi:hypothetical protein
VLYETTPFITPESHYGLKHMLAFSVLVPLSGMLFPYVNGICVSRKTITSITSLEAFFPSQFSQTDAIGTPSTGALIPVWQFMDNCAQLRIVFAFFLFQKYHLLEIMSHSFSINMSTVLSLLFSV